MKGLKKACSETKSLNMGYIQISYDINADEVLTDYHCDSNGITRYNDEHIVTCGFTSDYMSMNEIKEMILRHLSFNRDLYRKYRTDNSTYITRNYLNIKYAKIHALPYVVTDFTNSYRYIQKLKSDFKDALNTISFYINHIEPQDLIEEELEDYYTAKLKLSLINTRLHRYGIKLNVDIKEKMNYYENIIVAHMNKMERKEVN